MRIFFALLIFTHLVLVAFHFVNAPSEIGEEVDLTGGGGTTYTAK